MLFIKDQRKSLKANHNVVGEAMSLNSVVYQRSKKKFESKSQLKNHRTKYSYVVYQRSKKKFESKSQLINEYFKDNGSCLSKIKEKV